jgi:hypothetical protein
MMLVLISRGESGLGNYDRLHADGTVAKVLFRSFRIWHRQRLVIVVGRRRSKLARWEECQTTHIGRRCARILVSVSYERGGERSFQTKDIVHLQESWPKSILGIQNSNL